jgi:hypothetical protein
MTVFVYRNGKVVPKSWRSPAPGGFPSPTVSRFESMQSPVTDKTISSWRERDRDMEAAGAVDPRDIPKAVFDKRKEVVKRNASAESDT